jgi:hypothetical protein
VITAKEQDQNLHEVFFKDKLIGCLIRSDDGYFYYSPGKTSGLWGEWEMRAIADKLKEMNAEWDDKVKEELYQKKHEQDKKDNQPWTWREDNL